LKGFLLHFCLRLQGRKKKEGRTSVWIDMTSINQPGCTHTGKRRRKKERKKERKKKNNFWKE
jgi:hypothetical protein